MWKRKQHHVCLGVAISGDGRASKCEHARVFVSAPMRIANPTNDDADTLILFWVLCIESQSWFFVDRILNLFCNEIPSPKHAGDCNSTWQQMGVELVCRFLFPLGSQCLCVAAPFYHFCHGLVCSCFLQLRTCQCFLATARPCESCKNI